MKLHGPFEIKPGPNPRIICKWCKLHVAVRTSGVDELNYLICTRPTCVAKRPSSESAKYSNEIIAQIMIYGAQIQSKGLYFEQPSEETTP